METLGSKSQEYSGQITPPLHPGDDGKFPSAGLYRGAQVPATALINAAWAGLDTSLLLSPIPNVLSKNHFFKINSLCASLCIPRTQSSPHPPTISRCSQLCWQVLKNVFTTLSLWGNANQNCFEIPSHPRNQRTTNTAKDT